MKKKYQLENVAFPVSEFRAVEGEEGRMIRGSAVVYNALSEDLGGFRERFLPGSLTKTLQESNVKAVWNHDDKYVLGSRKAGTLRLMDTDQQLAFEVDPPDTSWARDLMVSIERGDIDQMSFRFRTVRDDWEKTPTGDVIRNIREARLIEVSPVSFPAYPQTAVSLRALLGVELDDSEVERLLISARSGQLEESDQRSIENIIEALTSLLPAPVQADHPGERDAQGNHSDWGTSYLEREEALAAKLMD